MPSMGSILACCGASKKALDADAETRRARIVSVYNPSRNASLCSMTQTNPYQPPPKYSDAIRDQVVYVSADEKDSNMFVQHESGPQMPRQRRSSPAPTFSDDSSIISIPSTRLSGITSTCTRQSSRTQRRLGDTASERLRNSWRNSGTYSDFSSIAPPSYYAPSDDEADMETSELHPVMQVGWLARLRREADARASGLHANNP